MEYVDGSIVLNSSITRSIRDMKMEQKAMYTGINAFSYAMHRRVSVLQDIFTRPTRQFVFSFQGKYFH